MTTDAVKVLIVDDEPDVIRGFERILASEPYALLSAQSGEEALHVFRDQRPQVVVMDLRMPGADGLQTLRALRKIDPRLLVILMTAYGTNQTVIEAMKAGAYEYIQKPFKIERIREIVREAAHAAVQMRQVVTVQPRLLEEEHAAGIIGNSDAMREVFKKIGQVAATDATVLITGESGTGKELVARALYHHGGRAKRPFLAVNCAAIPEPLLESELFGHERGAFTGAVARRPGKFEAVDGGTLFLDEIGDMSPAIQAKILRVLQSGEVERLGSNQPLHVDVRLIAATHRDLEGMVRRSAFRADLFYRLNVVRIHLPPLRERVEDIALLVEYFLRKYRDESGCPGELRATPEAVEHLQSHSWPGNIREFENCIRTALLTIKGTTLGARDLTFAASPFTPTPAPSAVPAGRNGKTDAPSTPPVPSATETPAFAPGGGAFAPETEGVETLLRPLFDRLCALRDGRPDLDLFDVVERSLIAQALERTAGNQARAAQLLGIGRSTLRKRIARYGLSIQTRVQHQEEGEATL